MSETDYYKLLNIEKKASDSEIKKAYRKLAMKYHPDHTEGDKIAEEKFKKISEAYAVLSDKEKRKEYDTYGSNGFHQRFSQEDIFKGFDFADVLKGFGMGGSNFCSGKRGGMRFSFGDDSIFGAKQQVAKGSDLIYELPLTFSEVATGTDKVISFQHRGQSEKITVKIPAGMISGKKLRLSGKGETSHNGGSPGDLYIKAKMLDDPVYSLDGYDLGINCEIKLSESIIGTNISVPTIEGKELNLKIPPRTKHKTKMRLAGYGLPRRRSKKKGDLYAIIHVIIPKKLTKKQKVLIEKLAESGL